MDSDRYSLVDFIEFNDPDIFAKTRLFGEYKIDYIQKQYYTYFREICTPCTPRVTMFDRYENKKREMIMMASNNYLGLSYHPEVIEAGVKALRQYGSGLCGSPVLCGYTDLHRQLEIKLAEFKNCEDALLFPSGFSTNQGTISALVRKNDVVIVDRLDHASILDGCMASGAAFRPFAHNSIKSLRNVLGRHSNTAPDSGKLVIVEGVYSMDGDIAPLAEIVSAAHEFGARVMVDEAHATGVLGKTGRGSIEHHGLEGKVDIVMGTFSKSLGASGGFICSTREVIDYLRFYARSYFFSASLPPSVAGSVMKALELIQSGDKLRESLWWNINYMKGRLKELGFNVLDSNSAIIPIIIGDDVKLRKMAIEINGKGIYINSVFYPAVPRNSSRIRLSLMASHSKQDLDETLNVLEETGRKFGVIS
jgi:glycine C-acetyltransferase